MVVQLIMQCPTRSNSFILSHHLAPTIFRAFLSRNRVSGLQPWPLASKLKRTSTNSSPVFCGSLGSAPGVNFLGPRRTNLPWVFRLAILPGSLSVRRTTRWLSSATIVPWTHVRISRQSRESNNSATVRFASRRINSLCFVGIAAT